MNTWAVEELELLHRCWPDLVHAEGTGWCQIPSFAVPEGWNRTVASVAFQLPNDLPGQAPYAFLIRGGLALVSGVAPTNYTFPVQTTPWGGDWGQFSWQLEPWVPGSLPGDGTCMVDFVRSFSARLRELN
jgi:hypothetical protein